MTEKPFEDESQASNWIATNCKGCIFRDLKFVLKFGDACSIRIWVDKAYNLSTREHAYLAGHIPYEIARNMGYYERGNKRLFPCKMREVD